MSDGSKNKHGGEIFKHLKSENEYLFLYEGILESDGSKVVAYQSMDTGQVWVRNKAEFFDGRFERVE